MGSLALDRKVDDEGQILAAYLPKLTRLAEANLSELLGRKEGAEDVSGTVMRTVIRRFRNGELEIDESDEFWKLLVVITLNKVRRKARYWTAAKRSIHRETALSDDGPILADLAVYRAELLSDPTDEQAEEYVDVLNRLKARLAPKYATTITLKMNGLSVEEIAEQLNVSSRSVRRYLEVVREELMDMIRQDV